MPTAFLLAIAFATWSAPAFSAPRSHSAKADFQRATPCPVNDAHRGPCPGYVIDHVVPLCASGADAVSNMQWQTVADAKVKDREERRQCRRSSRGS